MTTTATTIPQQSEIAQRLPGADFHDCYTMDTQPNQLSALETYLKVAATTPRWVNLAMALRNRIVKLFGLKDLGLLSAIDPAKPASAYQVGDRVGIFRIRYLSEQEVILGDADKHLRVELSVCKTPHQVSVSTVVHIHNALGRIYMFFVAPAHRRIVPATMRKASFL
ncbi:DUF2867 domain-containing protein [Duganella radicis]|uniref:DUF2867 domain-containing protein n=1 Tax=Duganella radicis TaxID=551988 RepID=A0A6L6PL21_9BURK|nr:DUF2867 domain-containing protein [Duganella radicis]MTV39643.1 DUF2867 domain-containing protein [Duganella radicis]